MKNQKRNILLGILLSITPLLAYSDQSMEEAINMGVFTIVLIGLLYFGITIMFLVTQSSFAKAIKTTQEHQNTNSIWIWTQLIPIWALIAIPITLIKLNNQFQVFRNENKIDTMNSIKQYSNTWGWVWFGGTVLSIVFQLFAIVALVGFIGFWIHISSVKKSVLQAQSLED